jgi:hypothetical protein
MTTINWQISSLDCIPSQDGHTNVVKTVHWRCEGTDEGHSGSVYATCTLPPPEADFTVYEDLTMETVLGWIWANGVDKTATEAAVQSQIDTAKNPPIVQPALPWSL